MTTFAVTRRLAAGLALGSLVLACASKKDANPVPVPFAVQFPSTAAAVYIDTVQINVFDSTQTCASLIALQSSGQTLPTPVVPIPEQTPCALEGSLSVDLPVGANYVFFAVASHQGTPKFLGCVEEDNFGNAQALDVALSYIDTTVSVDPTSCFKLSDFCNGACQ